MKTLPFLLLFSYALLADGPTVEHYERAKHTQTIFILNDQDTIRRVPPDPEWTVSGGMAGIDRSLWTSEKSRYVPGTVRYRVASITVKNGIKSPTGEEYTQQNRAIVREYPAGTQFHDVLKNHKGEVFEHRVREKLPSGVWRARVAFSNVKARPAGYTGLKVSCGSCHDQAGTGKYGSGNPPKGLVPGGDTIFSDPLDWSVARPYER